MEAYSDSVEYRNPTLDDVDTVVEVINRSRHELPFSKKTTAEELMTWDFKEPSFDSTGLWLAIKNGQAVGYGGARIFDSQIQAGINDGWINIEIVPEYRDAGIGQEIMKLSLDYLKSNNTEIAVQEIKNTPEWKHSIVREFGFKDVRTIHCMSRENNDNLPSYDQTLSEIEIEDKLLEDMPDSEIENVVNKLNQYFSFSTHSYTPMSSDNVIKLRDNGQDTTRFAFAKKGDEIIGIMMGREKINQNMEKEAYFESIGVDNDYRRKGIGKALMYNFMKWSYKDRGVDRVRFTVDPKNKGAIKLYDTLGFKIDDKITHYELLLQP